MYDFNSLINNFQFYELQRPSQMHHVAVATLL